jgi:hypothetical protein
METSPETPEDNLSQDNMAASNEIPLDAQDAVHRDISDESPVAMQGEPEEPALDEPVDDADEEDDEELTSDETLDDFDSDYEEEEDEEEDDNMNDDDYSDNDLSENGNEDDTTN